MKDKITASFIIEILGRPAEHISASLNALIDKISKEEGVRIIEKKVHEPKKVEDAEGLFTSFAEVEAEFDSIASMLVVTFNYMPSNFEIIRPEELIIKNEHLADVISGILLRIHKYDELAKKLVMDNKILERRVGDLVTYIKSKEPEKFKDNAELKDISEEKNDSKKSEKKKSKKK